MSKKSVIVIFLIFFEKIFRGFFCCIIIQHFTMFLPQKTPKFFECKSCDFITSNLKDYNRHLNTRKHLNTTKYNNFTPKNPKLFTCDCGKSYPYRGSLYNHRKNCKNLNKKVTDNE